MLHHVSAITNTYLFPLPGCEHDAVSFHRAATGDLDDGLLTMPYVQALQALYGIIGPSQFTASQFSVLFFALALLPFVDLCQLCRVRSSQAGLVLLLSCLPVMVFAWSAMLRESFQFFAVVCVAWSILNFSHSGSRTVSTAVFALGIGLLLVLHRGLVYYAIAMVAVAYVRLARSTVGLLFSLGVAAAFVVGYTYLAPANSHSDGGGSSFFYAVTHYREGVTIGRSHYEAKLSDASVLEFVLTACRALVYYLFAPFPWMINGLPDFYALLESIFRMIMVVGLVCNVRESKGQRHSDLVLLSVFFWSLELLWSLGTTNWGTAIRHRTIAYGFLVILGGDWWLYRFLNRRADPIWGQELNPSKTPASPSAELVCPE